MVTAPPKQTTASVDTKLVGYDEYVDQQITKTRWNVRLIELASSVIVLLAGVLGYLLLLVVIDHWVAGLGFWARLIALSVLVFGAAVFAIARVLPAIVRSINPVYAAHVIEQSEPSFKNSLVNLLLLRSHKSELRRVVYDAVEQQAAASLTNVKVDSAVDRGSVIRAGYVLVAILALTCVYKFLSPKDPFQTIARVVAPWHQIDRPSRVEIRDLQPGDASVYRGQTVDLTARVDGLSEDEEVFAQLSTRDGQIVDQRIPLKKGGKDGRYHVTLLDRKRGLQQSVSYRLLAGDAETRQYHIEVVDAPVISVDRLQYDYPDYTQQVDEVVQGQGEIRALEGTRVTIHAEANQPIRSAHIELLTGDTEAVPTRKLPMKFDGQRAHATITLLLQQDRTTPQYSGYRLRFTNESGERSRQPVEHRIEVVPDLPPVIEILKPKQREVELPINSMLPIEIRAADADYGLNRVAIVARCNGQQLFEQDLLGEPQNGQAILDFDFVPGSYELQEGDVVEYHALADDNRTSPRTREPDPNTVSTPTYKVFLVAPQEGAEQSQSQNRQQQRDQDQDDAQQDPSDSDDGSASDESNQANDQDNSQQSDENSDQENADQNDAQQDPGQGDHQESSDGGEGSEGTEQNSSKQDSQSAQDQPNGSEGADSSTGTSESTDHQDNRGQSTDDPGDGSQPSAAEQNEAQQSPTGQSDPSQPREGDQPGNNADSRSRGQQQESSGGRGADQKPLPPDGSRDGDVIERIQDYIENQQDQAESGSSDSQDDQQQNRAAQKTQSARENEADSQEPTNGGDTKDTAAQESTGEDATATTTGEEADEQDGEGRGSGEQQRPTEDPNQQDQQDQQNRRSNQREPDGSDRDNGGNEPEQDTAAKTNDRQGTEEENGTGASSTQQPQDPADSSQSRSKPQQDTAQEGSEASSPTEQDGSADSSPKDQTAGTGQSQSPQDAGQRPPQPNDAIESDEQNRSGQPSGDASADGSAERQSESDDAEPGANGSESDADASRPPRDQPSEQNGHGTERTGGANSGHSGTPPESPEVDDRVLGSDDPNLEYARKQTDLVLDYLKNQQKDQKLLDELGWTDEDMRKFLDRWEAMKKNAAQQPDSAAKRKFDETLKSLGLKPRKESRRIGNQSSDEVRSMRQSGASSAPPAEYVEQFRAFQKSSARRATP